jgi:non-specific serine/threonine protein kinase/protein-serine/threonine kinase
MERIPEPAKGDRIDGFTLGERLHRGGFSTIWAVTHPTIPVPMVIKIPTLGTGHDAPAIVGFEVEQMILPRLAGAHVPRYLAGGDFATRPFIVTERIPGASMWALAKRAPLPIDELIEVAARMAQAVHDLHRQGVIHLDLKPDNFLQRPSGDMVLIDFGLSRHEQLPDLLDEEFTIPMGTFPYIAPEQVLRQRGDRRSDLFALGVMLYQLATGALPFGEPQDLKAVRARLWRDPMPPRALRPDVPEWLQEIILRAVEVDPDRRYQSAAQMMFDLGHPMQVRLTARAHKRARISLTEELRRRWQMRRVTGLGSGLDTSGGPDAPILLVAVDLSPGMEPLAAHLLRAVKRMLVIEPDARVACINVRPPPKRGLYSDEGHLHVSRLVGLRTWAEGIDLPDDRLTFSVLENADPASAILEHAGVVGADHILMGARGHSTTRRYLGSVSARVVAEAPTSVTVIRLPEAREPSAGAS